jgi:hypothetical protein
MLPRTEPQIAYHPGSARSTDAAIYGKTPAARAILDLFR